MTTCPAGPAAPQAFHEDIFSGSYKWHSIDVSIKFFEHRFQRICLGRCAGEAIQNGAGFTVWTTEAIAYHGYGHIVGDQFAFGHIGLSKFSKLSLVLKVLSEQ